MKKTDRKIIEHQNFDEERALYNIKHADIVGCSFDGPQDGESALKETEDINIKEGFFSLRYPLWHVKGFTFENCEMTEGTRAPFWYCNNGKISGTSIHGTKAIRECKDISVENSVIVSDEFGWKSDGINLSDLAIESQYLFLDSKNILIKNIQMKGKYSFQYTENVTIMDSALVTKDAFWHSKNVTVKNCIVKGEYLGWFSEGLTLIDCKIIGTQPLCYCKDLKIENCVMENCDLSFEYSDVEATIYGHVDSIKNPKSGTITLDSVGKVVRGETAMKCTGEVIIR